jgi:NADP-dependent 3-hydroxy acid dehydrogenase YdfG
MSLQNKVVVITGASRGIGSEIALMLAKEKAIISLIARNAHDLKSVKEEIEKTGGKALINIADIRNSLEIKTAIDNTLKEFGQIDVMINNAGVGAFSLAENTSLEAWQNMMDVNVTATFLFSKEVIPHMKKNKSGHIITIASDVSKRTFEEGAAYCASKYAQDAFSSAMRKDVRKFGIKVSVIYPGMVDTYFANTTQGASHKKDWLKAEDIANGVLYILKTPKHVVIDELMIHPLSQEY